MVSVNSFDLTVHNRQFWMRISNNRYDSLSYNSLGIHGRINPDERFISSPAALMECFRYELFSADR
jgi:hypothetical protein